MAAEAFFARLPRGLSSEESELRRLLHDTALAASKLLPRAGVVSLQEWIERRIPGELEFGGPPGSVDLRPAKAAVPAVPAPPRHVAPPVVPPRNVAPPPRSEHLASAPRNVAPPPRNNENFFNSLPRDSFSPGELRLRDVLMEMLAQGPLPLPRVLNDGQVGLAKQFLPQGVMIEDWIERRAGQEMMVFSDKAGKTMLKIAPPSKEDRLNNVEAFFADLPEDSFTEMELQLREAILNAISRGATTLSFVGSDKEVGAARKACLISGVSLKEWIQRRIASEVIVDEVHNGQCAVRLAQDEPPEPSQQGGKSHQAGKGVDRVSFNPYAAVDRMDDRKDEDDEQRRLEIEEQKRLDREEKEKMREAFFDELPEDCLSEGECTLREAILDFLDGWRQDIPASLSNAGAHEKVNAARAALLPKGISLRDWIDRRVGMEIELVRLEDSEVFLGKRGEIDPVALEKGIERLKVSKSARAREGKGGAKGKKDSKGKKDFKGTDVKGNVRGGDTKGKGKDAKGMGKSHTGKGKAAIEDGGRREAGNEAGANPFRMRFREAGKGKGDAAGGKGKADAAGGKGKSDKAGGKGKAGKEGGGRVKFRNRGKGSGKSEMEPPAKRMRM